MSPIGRIFLVVNLALSAIFLGWAANALSTSQDWKTQYETAVQEKADLEDAKDAEIASLQQSKDNTDEQNRQLREERNQFENESNDLRAQLKDEKSRNDDLASNVTSIQAKLGDFNDTISQLEQAKDRALERASQAEKDRDAAQNESRAAEMARRDAADAQSQAEQLVAQLESAKRALEDQVSQMETKLTVALQRGGISRDLVEALPKIDASVLDVRMQPSPGLVMLNVGKNREVKPGYTFDIYSGGIYKGQVRVENVQEQMCSALITHAVDGQAISQGDRASTQL